MIKTFSMKFIFLALLFFGLVSCKKEPISKPEKNPILEKEKYQVEAERDVDSIDPSIQANSDDFKRIGFEIFPSFEEAVRILIDFNANTTELTFMQITQTLDHYLPENFHSMDSVTLVETQYKMMKENRSIDFHSEISEKEKQEILQNLVLFKQANYKSKFKQLNDGMTSYFFVLEKDTIIAVSTNSPSSHQKKLLETVLNITGNHAKDSITKRNIKVLIENL
jgi:hypothetical protein